MTQITTTILPGGLAALQGWKLRNEISPLDLAHPYRCFKHEDRRCTITSEHANFDPETDKSFIDLHLTCIDTLERFIIKFQD